MSTNFSKGLEVYGVPVLPNSGQYTTTGNVFFVDSGNVNGADDIGTSGKDTTRPFSTVDYAINQTTANNGDVIFVMPGHTETISSATSLVPDVAGIAILGLGQGADRPTFTFSATTSKIKITGASTRISNCIFTATTGASPTIGVQVSAASCIIDNNLFKAATASSTRCFVSEVQLGSTVGTSVEAADDTVIYSNVFKSGSSSGTSQHGIRLSTTGSTGADNIQIVDNFFAGQWTTSSGAGIYSSSSDKAHTNAIITDNYINNKYIGATGAGVIDINNAITGMLINNRGAIVALGSVANSLDPGSCLCVENYVVSAIDESGIIVPTTAST